MDEQFGKLATLQLPKMQSLNTRMCEDDSDPESYQLSGSPAARQNAWWETVTKGEDQLRQRVAFALMAAQLISVREILGMKRQIFFVGLGGWDTHGNQLADHSDRLAKLDHAMDSFHQTTVELGMADSIVAFPASEFGRTLTSNGDGTDHAWGGHCLAMGGNVDGGKIHGELPTLEIGGPDDAGDNGRIIPKYSVDQYGATLAKWMGVDDTDRLTIFPNLGNFATRDLGFMKS